MAAKKAVTEKVGDNVVVIIDNNSQKMIIEIDLTKDFGESKSGKTIGVASTRGNKKFQVDKMQDIHLGLNLYKYPLQK